MPRFDRVRQRGPLNQIMWSVKQNERPLRGCSIAGTLTPLFSTLSDLLVLVLVGRLRVVGGLSKVSPRTTPRTFRQQPGSQSAELLCVGSYWDSYLRPPKALQ